MDLYYAVGFLSLLPIMLAGCSTAVTSHRQDVAAIRLGVTGTIRFHGKFPSRFVVARNVEVWLPRSYDRQSRNRYPVIYMHDGQNVFAPATSFVGVDWAVDETMTRLIAEKRIRPALIVAIWNSADRIAEYMPRKALTIDRDIPSGVAGGRPIQGPIRSDAYLRFIVEELKPFIDSAYRTLSGPGDTFLMGSSMGGLISLYGVFEYPQVFGGAACVSTHWPAGDAAMVTYLGSALPKPGNHRFYFDHGTETLDALYPALQATVDQSVRAAGYVDGVDWTTRVFPGADHSERSWRQRVSAPLIFLLGTHSPRMFRSGR